MRGEDTGRHRAITTILFPPPHPSPCVPSPLQVFPPSKMAEVRSFLLLFSVIISMELSFSARIAGLSGTSSGSHYFTIKKVMEELFSRGHEVRVSFFHISCGPNCSKYILETCVYRLLKGNFLRGRMLTTSQLVKLCI